MSPCRRHPVTVGGALPYGQIFIMKADGSEKRQLTDSLWEDAMPRFVPKTVRASF